MLVRMGSTTVEVDGQALPHHVLQALDPDTGMPIAQIALPAGHETTVMIGKVLSGETPEQAAGLIVPDAPPLPPDLRG